MEAAGTAEGVRLFRPEALEAQRQAGLGRILINPPLAHGLLAAVAAALVAALFGFLWFAHYTPHVQAQGVLIAASSRTGQRLDAQLLIPAGAIAAVRPGLPVQLRYAVYPYTHLRQRGTVARIDPVPVVGAEVSTPGIAHSATFYRVTVRLTHGVASSTLGATLKPGMALRGQIALQRRRQLRGSSALSPPLRTSGQRFGCHSGQFIQVPRRHVLAADLLAARQRLARRMMLCKPYPESVCAWRAYSMPEAWG